MDKPKAKQRKEVDWRQVAIDSSKFPDFNVRMSSDRIPEYKAITNSALQEFERCRANLNKGFASFWAKDKTVLEAMRQLQEKDFVNGINFYTAFYALDYVETRLENLEKIVEGITKLKDVDLPELKSQIKTLQETLAQPELAEVAQFVRDTKAMISDREKKAKEARDRIVS